MEANFSPVSDAAALEELFARSHEEPVLLFKHSNACPISARAYSQMTAVKTPVSIVVVQKSRDISREVEQQTDVRHETPQAHDHRNGHDDRNASHFDITSDVVDQAVREN